MFGPRRAICSLRNGVPAQQQTRFIQSQILHPLPRQLEPTVGRGESDDPQLAGYPQLEGRSNQERGPKKYEDPTHPGATKKWDDVQYRRNFEETLHEEDEALNMFSPDLAHTNIEPRTALKQAALAFTIIGGIMGVLAYTRPTPPVEKRSYPYDGLVTELGGWDANKAKTELLDEH